MWRCQSRLQRDAMLPSTMWSVQLPDDGYPLYERVAAEIRRAIAEGEAKPGERLPPARDLAHVLEVNSNTVFRAMRILRDEGLLEFRRGRGVTVVGSAPERSVVVSMARELIDFSRSLGFPRDELVRLIETL
jgi:GntR family transcriptional regulator